MDKTSRTHKAHVRTVLIVYYVVLLFYILTSFIPQHRIWGINVWAYFPGFVPWLVFAVGAVAPVVLWFLRFDDGKRTRDGKFVVISFSIVILYTLAFYFLRVRTHFLGDGLTSLSYLASDNPLFKSRELGETLIHIWLKSALGGDPQQNALLSFQLISIAAGVLFVITAAWAAGLLFERLRDRVLFVLGLATGGYMLLFFGYVEYYSMFVMSVALFGLTGLLIARGRLSRWLILPALGMSMFFHVLGATLVPSAVYILSANSRIGDVVSKMKLVIKTVIVLSIATVGIVAFVHYYQTSYFFRFAFVPLLADRFTVEGYTLLSINHLLDLLNLLILILPALPLLVAVLFFLPLRSLARRREYRFLAVLLVSAFGAVFIFDPKMGMPRDWDLFCFAGVPLALAFYFVILDSSKRIEAYAKVGILAIVLGFVSLSGRVATHNNFDASVAQFEHYIALDRKKCAKGRSLLMNYYSDRGDTAKAQTERARWQVEVPERSLFMKAYSLYEYDVNQSMKLLRQITDMNPLWQDAWGNLGQCFMKLRLYDSAEVYLKIALGINPYDEGTWNNLGTTYMHMKDYPKAEWALQKAISLNNASSEPHQNLITLYKYMYLPERLPRYLREAASRKDSPFIVFKELGDYYVRMSAYVDAAEAYKSALARGMDSAYIHTQAAKYPQLKDLLK